MSHDIAHRQDLPLSFSLGLSGPEVQYGEWLTFDDNWEIDLHEDTDQSDAWGAISHIAMSSVIPKGIDKIYSSVDGAFLRGVFLRASDLDSPRMLKFNSIAGHPIYQPITQVQCNWSPGNQSQIDLPHDFLVVPPLNEHVFEKWSVEWRGTKVKYPGTDVSIQWVDPRDFGDKFSLGAIFRFQSSKLREALNQTTSDDEVTFAACTVDARWFATGFTYYSRSMEKPKAERKDRLSAIIGFPMQSKTQGVGYINGKWNQIPRIISETTLPRNERIRVDPEWAAYLESPLPRGNETHLSKILRSFIDEVTMDIWDEATMNDYSTDSLLAGIRRILSISISNSLAELDIASNNVIENMDIGIKTQSGMRWFGFENGWTFQAPPHRGEFSELFRDIELWRHGYVFGKNTIIGYFAVTILLIQATLALLHMGWMLWTRRGSTRWDSIGELIALAMNSRPTEKLRNMCAGIDRLDSWTPIVKIRDMGNDHLELVFSEDEDYPQKKPSEEKLYGTFPTDDH